MPSKLKWITDSPYLDEVSDIHDKAAEKTLMKAHMIKSHQGIHTCRMKYLMLYLKWIALLCGVAYMHAATYVHPYISIKKTSHFFTIQEALTLMCQWVIEVWKKCWSHLDNESTFAVLRYNHVSIYLLKTELKPKENVVAKHSGLKSWAETEWHHFAARSQQSHIVVETITMNKLMQNIWI